MGIRKSLTYGTVCFSSFESLQDLKLYRNMILDMSTGDSLLAVFIGLLGAFLLHVASKLFEASVPFHATADKLKSAFPNALTNKELLAFIRKKLNKYKYGNSTLVATSLCCDEVNRTLENDLRDLYGCYFSMGGLAGKSTGCREVQIALDFLILSCAS